MDGRAEDLMVETPNLADTPIASPSVVSGAPDLGALTSLYRHWPEYFMEAALLGVFVISACVFGALYEFPLSPILLERLGVSRSEYEQNRQREHEFALAQ